MRVVQLAGYAAPYGGSFVPMLRAVAGAAQARGWSVETVLPDAAKERPWVSELEGGGSPLIFSGARGRRAATAAVAELLGAAGEPTVLHSHFTRFDVPVALAARGRGATAVVWQLHSRLEPGPLAWARNNVKFRLAGRSVDRILCVAENIAAAARARGAPPGRTVVWPNAIDLERFPLTTRDARREARQRLGLPEEAEVVVHFGWEWHRKGGDLYVAAMRRLRAAPRDLPLVAVTVGGERGVPEGDTGGLVVLAPQERVQTVYEAADVFVSSSRAEGMPFSMAEALASGVAVVATDIPGQAAIGSGVEACRLTSADPEQIAAGVAELLEREPGEVARQGAAARESLVASMDVGPWAARLADLYEELVRPSSTQLTRQRIPRAR